MASIVFEVECECEGVITPAEPDVGIFGAGVEDADLTSVSMLVLDWTGERGTIDRRRVWKNVDLLDGIDKAARQRVIQNIIAAFGSDIDEAILSDA